MHRHTYHELLWGTTGPFSVCTDETMWIVPPVLGLLVPADVRHGGHSRGGVHYYATEFDPDTFTWAARRPQAVVVPSATRELLLLHATRTTQARLDVSTRAAQLAFDLLTPTISGAIELPMPTDTRARHIADNLLANPAGQRTLDEWGHHVGASTRTLSRLFHDQTGLSFARWRTNARIGTSIALLGDNVGLGAIARTVGYQTASAFARAFRETTGQTPRSYARTNMTPPQHASPPARPQGPGQGER